jgi:predicted amino acid dehydrogenase
MYGSRSADMSSTRKKMMFGRWGGTTAAALAGDARVTARTTATATAQPFLIFPDI